YEDAERQTRTVLHALEQHGFVQQPAQEEERDNLIVEASQKALERFDEIMRELARKRYQAVEEELGPVLTRFAVGETIRRFRQTGELHWSLGTNEKDKLDRLAEKLTPKFGRWLAKDPSLEDVTHLTRDVAKELKEIAVLEDPAAALSSKASPTQKALHQFTEF